MCLKEIVNELDELENCLESVSKDLKASDNSELQKSLLMDDSDTCSDFLTSDLVSNPDSESFFNVAADSGVEDIDETPKTEKKEKLKRLKNVFQDQLKDLSLDTMLLAGAQAASQISWPGHVTFSPSPNQSTSDTPWLARSSVRGTSPTSNIESPVDDKPSNLPESTATNSANENVGSWEDGESDSEGK